MVAERGDAAMEKKVASQSTSSSSKQSTSFKRIDELMVMVESGDNAPHALAEMALLMVSSPECQVYARTSNALHALCRRLCGGGLASPLEGAILLFDRIIR